jgi:hypothetical protein
MLSDEAPFILTDVFCVDLRKVEALLIESGEACFKSSHCLILSHDKHTLGPIVFDNAEQDRMKDFGRCI